jgi:hypothetical protein
MDKPLVVNFFGGPGAGKSTTRAGVFNKLKLAGVNCEETVEWIKYRVYEGDSYAPTDQIYTFAKQRKFLMEIGSQVDVILTDSPLLLSIIYDKRQDPLLRQLVLSEFNRFNNVNFLLTRVKPYSAIGRYQTEGEAKDIDGKIVGMLTDNTVGFFTIRGNGRAKDVIADYILQVINS